MDYSQIGTTVGGLAGGLAALSVWFSTTQRRARNRTRQQAVDLDEAQRFIRGSIKTRHMHNNQWHEDGRGEIDIPPLPSFMTRMEDDDA